MIPLPAHGLPLARALAVTLALALLAAGGACQRRTRLVPASADSAAVVDSFAIRVREAQQRWDAAEGGEEAARLTAEILRRDLARHANEAWPPRVRALLDSLDVGAEIAADRRVVVVNFFSRAHPEGGSWPWAFWAADSGAGARPLAGQGLQLLQVASRAGGAAPSGIAVLFGRRAASGQQPLLMVWGDPARGGPEPLQTLGSDSLGGVGTGNFETMDTTVTLVTRAFRGMPRFEECATCPHVYSVRRFAWEGATFRKSEERAVPSPYSSFVLFVVALTAGDREGAARWSSGQEVLEAAKRYELGTAQRGVWRAAPATDESAHEMVFFRGQTEAYKVSFEPRGEDWVVASIVPTTRSIE